MQKIRRDRIAEQIKINLSTILQRDLAGRLPGMATIMHVELSNDVKFATVKISLYGSEEAKSRSFTILKHEVKNLRRLLGKTLSLRLVPALKLVQDSTLDDSFRIHQLLEQIHREKEKPDESQK